MLQTRKRTIYLTIQTVFFDMIASGVKKEEYRAIKPYYDERFRDAENIGFVTLVAGYRKSSPTMTVEVLSIAPGDMRPEWSGGETGRSYVIRLGKICSIANHVPGKSKRYRPTGLTYLKPTPERDSLQLLNDMEQGNTKSRNNRKPS